MLDGKWNYRKYRLEKVRIVQGMQDIPVLTTAKLLKHNMTTCLTFKVIHRLLQYK